MKPISKDDLLAMGIHAAQLVFVMDAATEDGELTDDEMHDLYNGTMTKLSKFLDAVIATYKLENPDTTLEDGEILHILTCSSCRTAITSGNSRVH